MGANTNSGVTRRATAGGLGLGLALAGFLSLALAAPVSAHYCHGDESDPPPGCYGVCKEGEDHDHFVDNTWPKENYECKTEKTGDTAQCADGSDNDGDGKVDTADPDCENVNDNWEGHDETDDGCKVLGQPMPDIVCDGPVVRPPGFPCESAVETTSARSFDVDQGGAVDLLKCPE